MSVAVVPVLLAATEDVSMPFSDSNLERELETPIPTSPLSTGGSSLRSELLLRKLVGGVARRTLGIILLLLTVFLWTASNFLASTMFADDSFSKPYFVTYINTSFFSIFLPAIFFRRLWATNGSISQVIYGKDHRNAYVRVIEDANEAYFERNGADLSGIAFPSSSALMDAQQTMGQSKELNGPEANRLTDKLNVRDTAKLSLEFCMLWANYFVAACLEYTTVASSTILTSTSSIWTLLFGALIGVEGFTLRKLVGVIASLAGVVLISRVDLAGDNDKNRGTFPHKSHKQIAIGDTLALASALLYGLYTIFMKKRIGDEARVNMLLFFGFVGAFNLVFLWPGFLLLHFTGVEAFELPPTRRIWTIILINSATSLISDVTWAYAMLLTSPLIVTVGLSLSIPLSLIGQMIINSQNSTFVYWVGAGIVFLSFIFINHETKEDDEKDEATSVEPIVSSR